MVPILPPRDRDYSPSEHASCFGGQKPLFLFSVLISPQALGKYLVKSLGQFHSVSEELKRVSKKFYS